MQSPVRCPAVGRSVGRKAVEAGTGRGTPRQNGLWWSDRSVYRENRLTIAMTIQRRAVKTIVPIMDAFQSIMLFVSQVSLIISSAYGSVTWRANRPAPGTNQPPDITYGNSMYSAGTWSVSQTPLAE